MGKAERNRQLSAREKIAAQQALDKRADQRRKGLIAGGSIVVVLVVVVTLTVVKLLGGSAKASDPGTANATTAATVGRDIASVPASTLDKVAAGPAYPAKGSVYPHAIRTISPAGAILTSSGKPEVVYVGAEYCPFCAAERWALSVALSRFGTFSRLHLIHSSSTDTDPNTPTVSFYKSTYSSKYVTFTTTEAQKVDKSPLQPVTALDKSLMGKYDAPPYVPSTQYDDSFPFVDFGNRYVIDGASYDPLLLANLSWQQIGADLANPNSPVGQAIDATANHITAAICKITNSQPGSVCSSTGVTSASGSI
jgi:thiol-disulfide isomerase/thioredoxin